MVGKRKVPTANEYDSAVSGSGKKKKEIKKLGDLNKETYGDLIPNINHTIREGSVVFSLVDSLQNGQVSGREL